MEDVFLQALHAEPGEEATWLALADWFEETGQDDRAEVVRLVRQLRRLSVMRRTQQRARLEKRLAELLDAGVPPAVPEVVNSIGMRLALIPPGRFRMGSPAEEQGRQVDEGPMHQVELTRPFYLGVFLVTQAQYARVMGSNPSFFSATGGGWSEVEGLDTSDFPVEQVSWEEACRFLDRLSARPEEAVRGRHYRLPSEAEWEYSCRGGASSTTPFHCGNSLSSAQANFDGNHPYGEGPLGPYLGRTCPVGSYRPNALGLYDMHGNVWEWCADWYAEDYYKTSPRCDPPGPSEGSKRVIRGGNWFLDGWNCRSAYLYRRLIDDRIQYAGFRAACDIDGP